MLRHPSDNCNSYADGKRWLIGIFRKKIANSPCHQCGGGCACLCRDHSKLIATLPCCGVYGPGSSPPGLRHSQSARPRQVPKSIVDRFQSIEVQQ